ncbi:undecaprenyl-phosphate galactose phosphotransferase WbaP [Treponema sp.]|uniref:undecaprenyl-phosphate galactose phosphotransferase WbaP n=1 Tax=Treponema sp. TaxID=166 RepID=UPI003F04B331
MISNINAEELENNLKSQYKYTSSFVSGISLGFIDAFIFMISTCIGFFIINAIDPSCINFRSFFKYSIFLPGISVIFYASGLYPGILLAPEDEVKRFSTASFFILIGEAFALTTIKSTRDVIPITAALIISWPFATILLPLGRELSRRFFGKFSWWGVPAIIYSKGDRANLIVERLLKKKNLGYKPVLIITDEDPASEEFMGIKVVKQSPGLLEIIKKTNIKVAILCGFNKNIEELQTYYRYLIRVPREQLNTTMSLHMKDFGGILAFSSTNYLTKKSAMFIKRSIDILACLCAAPIAVPLTIIIAIAIKITSPGPVFYGHKRVGKNHTVLKCWKFRSMCIDADKKLAEILKNDPVRAEEWEKDRKFTDDPRVTKFGKFLRKTSLDEIPQLWNIFVGEMSLVGPRPVTEAELIKYGKYSDYVLSVKPGLSGMWQISGRSDTGYEERINLDTYYIQNWSVWLDIWILIKTIGVVIRGKGAY